MVDKKYCLLQVSSGKYPGLVWDDDAKTMFRIPWKHAGKQDFRKDEDAAIFKVNVCLMSLNYTEHSMKLSDHLVCVLLRPGQSSKGS